MTKKEQTYIDSLVEKLKLPNTTSELCFQCVRSSDKDKIVVAYWGHQVSGSYVHDYQVAPSYVDDLEYTTNCRVKWIGRDTSAPMYMGFGERHWGQDLYLFEVYPKQVINAKPYIPKGKIYRVDSHYAFNSSGKEEWCYLQMIHAYLLKKPKHTGGLRLSRKVIWYKDHKLAKVVSYVKPYHFVRTGHNVSYGRTHYQEVYDLFIEDRKFIAFTYSLYKDIVNEQLKYLKSDITCTEVCELSHPNSGNRLGIMFSDGTFVGFSSQYYIVELKEMKDIISSQRRDQSILNKDRYALSKYWRSCMSIVEFF